MSGHPRILFSQNAPLPHPHTACGETPAVSGRTSWRLRLWPPSTHRRRQGVAPGFHPGSGPSKFPLPDQRRYPHPAPSGLQGPAPQPRLTWHTGAAAMRSTVAVPWLQGSQHRPACAAPAPPTPSAWGQVSAEVPPQQTVDSILPRLLFSLTDFQGLLDILQAALEQNCPKAVFVEVQKEPGRRALALGMLQSCCLGPEISLACPQYKAFCLARDENKLNSGSLN